MNKLASRSDVQAVAGGRRRGRPRIRRENYIKRNLERMGKTGELNQKIEGVGDC